MKRTRTAFTLVELLVVITIIGILMGLLIPAVNAAREAARRTQCATNLKSLGLAGYQHATSKGHLPGYVNRFGIYIGDGSGGQGPDPSEPGGANNVDAHVKIGTWAVALLPWLEAVPTYEHWTEDRYPLIAITGGEHEPSNDDSQEGVGFHPLASPNLAIFQCPSDATDDASQGKNSYISNNGMTLFITQASVDGDLPTAPAHGIASHITGTSGSSVFDKFNDAQVRANAAFNNQYQGRTTGVTPGTQNVVGSKVRLDDFKDGQGFTILFTENAQALPWHRAGYVNTSDLTAGIDFSVATPVVDIANNPADSSSALFAAPYTNGMVWHYEDKSSTSMPANPITGVGCRPVYVKHKINGEGLAPGQDVYTLQMTEASSNFIDLARPSSMHVEGVNTALADGATRFVVQSIDYRVYQAMCTLRGKSSDVPFTEFILTDELGD